MTTPVSATQEMFNSAWNGLIAQGGPSYSETPPSMSTRRTRAANLP